MVSLNRCILVLWMKVAIALAFLCILGGGVFLRTVSIHFFLLTIKYGTDLDYMIYSKIISPIATI